MHVLKDNKEKKNKEKYLYFSYNWEMSPQQGQYTV